MPLRDGRSIPQLGFGTGATPPGEAAGLVRAAVEAGYRYVDTAFIYGIEAGVGEGVRTSGVRREELFVATRLWCEFHGYDATLAAFDRTLKGMGLDYLDLYLIHWPNPDVGLYVDSWRAMMRLRDAGLIRSIGVCNFSPEHLDRLIGETGEAPVLNQIEMNPRFQQREMRVENAKRGIVTGSWGPVPHGWNPAVPVLAGIAARHGKSPLQVALRWQLQSGVVAIPRAETLERMRANLDVFDFELDEAEMAAVQGLDDPAGRDGPLPHQTLAERNAMLAAALARMTPPGP